MGEVNSSDYKVLCNKIDTLSKKVDKIEGKQDIYHSESQRRIVLAEKQLALMEQSYLAICKEIDDNVKTDINTLKDRQDKNDLLTKIVTGLQGLLTAALIYLGLRNT